MAKRNQMDRRSRRRQLPQRGYTQLLQGNRLATARATNVDMHVKHCFEVCRAVKNKTAGEAVVYLTKGSASIQTEPMFAEKLQLCPSVLEAATSESDARAPQWWDTEKAVSVLADTL